MKSNLQNDTKKWSAYGISVVLIVFMAFNCFFKVHYSVDAYSTFGGVHQNALWHIQNGRYFYTLLVYVVDRTGLNLVTDNILWVFLFMAALAISIIALSRRFIQLIDHTSTATEIMCILCVCLSFVNVFIAEWFQFTECLLMYTVSVLCSVGAVLLIPSKNGGAKAIERYAAAFILLNIAYNTYQISINFFVFYVLCFILLENKGALTIAGVKKTLQAALVVVGTFAINLCITKLLAACGVISDSSRMSGLSIDCLWGNTKLFLSKQNQSLLWLKSDGMMNAPDLLVLFIVLLTMGIYSFFANLKRKWYDILFALVLLSGGVFALFLSILITEPLWMPPRTIAPFFCVFTYLGCLIAMGKNKTIQKIVAVILVIVLCRQACCVQMYSSDVLISNACDKLWVEQVADKIESYEQNQGIQITKVGFAPDQQMKWHWNNDSAYCWDVCTRTISVDWARLGLFSYYTGAQYSLEDTPDEVKAYFSSRNWDTVNLEEQMIFDNDVCYICIF